jgi:hypothetical protein
MASGRGPGPVPPRSVTNIYISVFGSGGNRNLPPVAHMLKYRKTEIFFTNCKGKFLMVNSYLNDSSWNPEQIIIGGTIKLLISPALVAGLGFSTLAFELLSSSELESPDFFHSNILFFIFDAVLWNRNLRYRNCLTQRNQIRNRNAFRIRFRTGSGSDMK